MSDLIRREDVIKLVNQFVFGLCKEQNDEVRRTFNKYIEKMPTAYSVDKVIKELENAKTINIDVGFGTIYKTIRKDVVVEIVKQGNVSDDVCEWKYKDAYPYYKVGCRKYSVPIKRGDYCPYCGKNIKVME